MQFFHLPPEVPFTYCRICGKYFAHPSTPARQAWSRIHANSHPQRQHDYLKRSGLWLLPDAAYKLASYGVIPLRDLVMDDEVTAALRESKPLISSRATNAP